MPDETPQAETPQAEITNMVEVPRLAIGLSRLKFATSITPDMLDLGQVCQAAGMHAHSHVAAGRLKLREGAEEPVDEEGNPIGAPVLLEVPIHVSRIALVQDDPEQMPNFELTMTPRLATNAIGSLLSVLTDEEREEALEHEAHMRTIKQQTVMLDDEGNRSSPDADDAEADASQPTLASLNGDPDLGEHGDD